MLPTEVPVALMDVLPAVPLDVHPAAPSAVPLDVHLAAPLAAGFADALFLLHCGIHDPIRGMGAISFIAFVKLARPSSV